MTPAGQCGTIWDRVLGQGTPHFGKVMEGKSESEIKQAIEQLKNSGTNVAKMTDYYNGKHDLRFASERFLNAFGKLFKTFALNMCPAVCDPLRDKLVIEEFRVEDGGTATIAADAWKLWQSNRMDIRSGEVHKEAAITGDAYVIVWPDANGKVTMYPNRSANVTVAYDDETPGKLLWAAKNWKTPEKKFRLNMYFPDRIEKYESTNKSDVELLPEMKSFKLIENGVIPNPYNIVPVFHFANNGGVGSMGVSELANAVPLQDALNKSVLDMLVAMEFQAYRQRWASGIELEYDDDGKPKAPFESGIATLWISEGENAKFGDFSETNLEQFLKVQDGFKVDLAIVTGTPIYYFIQTGANFPSGESLKKAETRFINKVIDRQKAFGAIWADVMAFALMIEGKGKDIQLFTDWADPAPLSEKERLDNLVVKQDLGVSETQLLIEAGYGEDEIKKMQTENAEKAQAAVDRFNAGEGMEDKETGNKETGR